MLHCTALHCTALQPHSDLQEADEASVIADAKARLPSEPAKADPYACRIGQHLSQDAVMHSTLVELQCACLVAVLAH